MTNPYATNHRGSSVPSNGGPPRQLARNWKDSMQRFFALSLIAATGLAALANADSKLNVVTATEDLAALSREVGGDKINVDSIAKGYQDPHFVEPTPSFLLKLQKADLLVV